MNQYGSESQSPAKKVKKNKCKVCKKKIGLLGFKCACSDTALFCSEHRLPESHNCEFDHKTKGKGLLADKLIKVEASKVIKI